MRAHTHIETSTQHRVDSLVDDDGGGGNSKIA